MRAPFPGGLTAGGASPGPGCHSQPPRCPQAAIPSPPGARPSSPAQGPACACLTARSPQVRGGAQPRGAQAERTAVPAGPEALLRGAVCTGLRRPVRLRVRRRRPAALVTTASRDCPRQCAGRSGFCVRLNRAVRQWALHRRRGALWGMANVIYVIYSARRRVREGHGGVSHHPGLHESDPPGTP